MLLLLCCCLARERNEQQGFANPLREDNPLARPNNLDPFRMPGIGWSTMPWTDHENESFAERVEESTRLRQEIEAASELFFVAAARHTKEEPREGGQQRRREVVSGAGDGGWPAGTAVVPVRSSIGLLGLGWWPIGRHRQRQGRLLAAAGSWHLHNFMCRAVQLSVFQDAE